MLIPILITIVVGYFLGALPFGFIMARAQGINIFEHGSKSPGATNVRRVLGEKFGARGKKLGNTVFALDALKGAVAAGWPLLAYYLKLWEAPDAHWDVLCVLGLGAAMIGHSFSCFTYFKGGKGVATGAGGFLVLMPVSLVIALLVWWVLFETTRYVSLASILATASLPVTSLALNRIWGLPPMLVVIVSAGATIFVVFRHRTNIVRLMNGTENKFVKKSTPPGAAG